MSTDFKPGQLIDLEGVAQYLGQPLGSVRRWIHHPPEGFPQVVRLGTKIVVRWSQLERWATEPSIAEESDMEESKRRGQALREARLTSGGRSDKPRMPKRKLERTSAQIVAEALREAK